MLFEGKGQVVQGHRVVLFELQGGAVVANGRGVVVLGGQGKAEGVLDQGLGFGWFAIGGFKGQLEAGGGFAIEPFAQLHRAQLVEVGAGAVAGFSDSLQPAQGGFITAHTKNLPGDHHGGATKQNDQTDEVGLGKQMIHGPTWGKSAVGGANHCGETGRIHHG